MKYDRIIRKLRQNVHDNYDISEELGQRTTNLIHNVKRHIGISEIKEKYKDVSFLAKGNRVSFSVKDGVEEILPEKRCTKKGLITFIE